MGVLNPIVRTKGPMRASMNLADHTDRFEKLQAEVKKKMYNTNDKGHDTSAYGDEQPLKANQALVDVDKLLAIAIPAHFKHSTALLTKAGISTNILGNMRNKRPVRWPTVLKLANCIGVEDPFTLCIKTGEIKDFNDKS